MKVKLFVEKTIKKIERYLEDKITRNISLVTVEEEDIWGYTVVFQVGEDKELEGLHISFEELEEFEPNVLTEEEFDEAIEAMTKRYPTASETLIVPPSVYRAFNGKTWRGYVVESWDKFDKADDVVQSNPFYEYFKDEAETRDHSFMKGILFGDWDKYKQIRKEGENMKTEALYVFDVIIIDKETKEVVKRVESIVAKNKEEALSKAGYYDLLKEKDHNTEKFVVVVRDIIDFIPYTEED